MNPRFNEQISPVPWHLVRLRFHCTRLGIHWKGQQVPWHSFVCLYAEKPLKRKRNVCEQTRFQTRSGIVPCPTVVLQPFKTYFLGPSSSQLFCNWAMYHYFLLLFVFPTNPVWLRSSSDITQFMPNLGQVLPPQEVIIRSDRSRPSDKEGGGHPHPKIKDEGRSQKKLFPALCASVWSKYKGGPPPDVPLMRVQCIEYLSSRWREGYSGIQVMGEIEWIFWLWKFCLWDFFGQENLARTFWVDWVK